jgi:hypothetical protein
MYILFQEIQLFNWLKMSIKKQNSIIQKFWFKIQNRKYLIFENKYVFNIKYKSMKTAYLYQAFHISNVRFLKQLEI